MRICLISVEIFAWGKYGGFGKATRLIGRELVKRGHEVFAVVPRRSGQQPVERLDGITVLGFSPWRPWDSARLLEQCNADLYHSCEPSLATYFAMRVMPHKRHLVTFRDPRTWTDWRMEFDLPSLGRWQVLHNYWYENNRLVHRAISRMDAVYTSGRSLIPKVASMYRLPCPPRFLPTPVPMPARVEKASTPTVCAVARLDRRKRPQLFFELARRFPTVRFLAAGRSRDRRWEGALRREYGALPNLELLGFIDQFSDPRHTETLSKSWILVNTATREALPNAFLEAMAHGCALLSGVDPDRYATRFGCHVSGDQFAEGLAWLLAEDRWRSCGERAAEEIRGTFELDRAMAQHVAAYEEVLSRPPRPRPTHGDRLRNTTC